MPKPGTITTIDPHEFFNGKWGSIDAEAVREDKYHIWSFMDRQPDLHWPTTEEIITYAAQGRTPGDYSAFWRDVKRKGILVPPKVATRKALSRMGVNGAEKLLYRYPKAKNWIVDGHHRIAAAIKQNRSPIDIEWIEDLQAWLNSIHDKWGDNE